MVIPAKNESLVKVTKKCRCCYFGIGKTVESEIELIDLSNSSFSSKHLKLHKERSAGAYAELFGGRETFSSSIQAG